MGDVMKSKLILTSKLQSILCIIFGVLGVGGLIFYFVFSRLGKLIDLGSLSFINRYHTGIIIILIVLCFLFSILLVIKNRKYETRYLKAKRYVFSFLSVLICSIIILFLFIYSIQDYLIDRNNLIFQPNTISKETSDRFVFVYDNVEKISFTTEHNYKIQGWLVKNSSIEKSPLIIYFGGSGQEVSDMINYAEQLKGYSVALVNYRGFGTSEGSPSQDAVFNDSKLIYDTLSKRKDIDNKKIVTMGWSLGTAVSVFLSENRQVKGTILVAPIDNVYSRIHASVPFLPLSLIMKQKFDSISRAPSISTPLLCLIGDSDINVFPDSSLKLVERWKGTHIVKTYKDEDHFLLYHFNDSWTDINNFLKNILK